MSKSLIDELEKSKPIEVAPAQKDELAKRKYPKKEDFDRPLHISKYTNLFLWEQNYLRYVEKNRGSLAANQAHLLVMPTLDNEHTQFMRYLHLNRQHPGSETGQVHEFTATGLEELEKKYWSKYHWITAISLGVLFVAGGICKPPEQKHPLTKL